MQTEALLCTAQEQAFRTNSIKHHIDETTESLLCILCGGKDENVSHIESRCKKSAEKQYK